MKFYTPLLLLVLSAYSLSAQKTQTNKNNSTQPALDTITEKTKSDNELHEVIISASRQPESLDQVPSSVTLLSKKQIQQQLSISSNMSDILGASVPGLGFSTNRTSNLGQTLRGRRVLIMIDGIPQSTPLRDGAKDIRSLDPGALDRVEVIKGATAIYGNGADGGLINYITKKADQKKAFSGTTEAGSAFSLIKPKQTAGFFLSQLFSGKARKFDYVASGRYEETGLYRDAKGRVLSPDYGMNDLRNINAFAKLGYDFNENNRLEAMYNYYKSTQQTDYIAKAGVYGNFDRPTIGVKGSRPGENEGTPYNHNASLTYTGKNIIGHTDLSAVLYFQNYLTVINYSDFFENNGQPATQSKKLGFRLNMNSPYDVSNLINGSVTYGLDILSDVTDTHLTDGRLVIPEMKMSNLAPYFQIKNMFGPDLVLKTGLRLENVHINVPDYTTIAIRNYVAGTYFGGGVNVNGGSLDFNTLMFNAGLRYAKWNAFKPFVSFSQSFSVADLGLVLRQANENTVSNTSIKAVVANNYEMGFSGAISDLSYEGAVYYSTSKLGASYVYVDGKPQISRSPEKIYGFEIGAKYRFDPKFDLGANYSYTEGKRETASGEVYLGGDRINPPKLTAFASYRPLENWSLENWSLFMQMVNTSGRDRFKPVNGAYTYGTGPIKAFTAFNFSSSYVFKEKTTLRLGVENLFNKDYFSVISQWQVNNMSYVKENGARMTISLSHSF